MSSIAPEALSESFAFCERVTAENGRTYYMAARLLPSARRRAVHALYAFARGVDDLVDVVEPGAAADLSIRLGDVERATFAQLSESACVGASGSDPIGASGSDPIGAALPTELTKVLPAFAHTVKHFDIPVDYFHAFFRSMRMDAPGTPEFRPVYRTMNELNEYMYGSAVVIGLQLLPILGVGVPVEDAVTPASKLGEAFQLTNFIRDVGEDLDRGRLYLPLDEWAPFGVDVELLEHGRRTGVTDARVARALAHFIAVTRAQYRQAECGIEMLDPRVQPSIRTAYVLYGAILDQVESADFQILDRRVTVPTRTRVRVAVPALLRSAVRRPLPVRDE
ncbi:phytoene/squalene synthase family protein [Rhodococcus sp. IEGM 1379]|uniref:phytoene/squalene synthase family protein n=1 Tax=Rhodococcus sp. IEGM 1379 TaxID=3047086 RepID=UPI0024B783F2|nr:phytoene/squalene synthase family protein [Rhodococcus sp. IEGM 1379]MDI9914306.1 phytoene/squalene synthase family protein [Rhodococcus sp. IEGM 1379]